MLTSSEDLHADKWSWIDVQTGHEITFMWKLPRGGLKRFTKAVLRVNTVEDYVVFPHAHGEWTVPVSFYIHFLKARFIIV